MFINNRWTAKHLTSLAVAAVLSLGLLVSWGGQSAMAENAAQTATEQRKASFSVPGMDCVMCPMTVKQSLSKVEGVLEAEADLETRQAQAVFDPSQTNTDALIVAIENAGFSADLMETNNE